MRTMTGKRCVQFVALAFPVAANGPLSQDEIIDRL